jgi:hypothetical protein
MHDAPANTVLDNAPVPSWRGLLEKHHSVLVEELGRAIEAERRDAAVEAAESERSRAAGRLEAARTEARRLETEAVHQSVRRLRLASESREILRFLNENTSPWAQRSVVLVFENNQAVMVAVRGCEDRAASAFEIADAPALAAAIESQDPVVCLASPAEISPVLSAALEGVDGSDSATGAKAYLFPISARQSVRAILIAAGAVVPAPIELLCEAAGMKLEATELAPRRDEHERDAMQTSDSPSGPMQGLIHVMPAPAGSTAGRRTWAELPAAEQRLHLQAQHTVRVRVAALRLDHGEALGRGAAQRDVYAALKKEIDAERDDFRHDYLEKSPTMVDYLHLEILSRLAHNDEKLLGADYPGPMI